MQTVVIYPGRFHPFHKGHKSVYDTLVKKFGNDRVYIATSNKIDPPKSPFSFNEKRDMMALTGVDPSRVVQVVMPYVAKEITDSYDPDNTILLFAVSDKDMAIDPRFQFKPKQDGSPSYYQPAQKNMRPFSEHGYIITVPTLNFKVLGQPMRSASEFRANFAAADSDTQKAMMTDLFGSYDKRIHDIMSAKISEQLIRADGILEQLIELGADDKYIVEACQRMDMLKNKVLKEGRRQSLYQAIMEGGHSLPVNEAELACPVAAGDLAVNTENRDRTIKQFNYGPLNVDVPGDYWEKIADYWDTTEQAAKASNCGNCVAFDISERMKDCLPGDTFDDDDGELGYCWMHHFKCHSARSCHTWAKGGPIKSEKESAEWQGKAFGVKEEMDTDDQSVTNFEQESMQMQLMKIADSDDVKAPQRKVTTDDGETVNVARAQAKGILQLLKMDIKPDQKIMIQKQIQNAEGLRKIIDFVETNILESYDGGKGPGSDYRAYDEPDTKNNYEVKINGKPWKVFSSKTRANKAASTIANKTGKKVEVYATMKPVSEEITKFDKKDPMSSVIAIRGIGTMTIPQALDKIAEMTSKMAEVAKSKNAKDVQMNMDYYMNLLNTYIPSVQEAYKELAQQRKRGGTASRGIDKDIEEDSDRWDRYFSRGKYADPITRYLGRDEDDDYVIKQISPSTGGKKKGSRPPLDFDYFGDVNEHCGDPMAPEHQKGRVLLMKLYTKEMECNPGSPEHVELLGMINGVRKNIGLDENMFTDFAKNVGSAIAKPVKAVVNKTVKDFKDRPKQFGKK